MISHPATPPPLEPIGSDEQVGGKEIVSEGFGAVVDLEWAQE